MHSYYHFVSPGISWNSHPLDIWWPVDSSCLVGSLVMVEGICIAAKILKLASCLLVVALVWQISEGMMLRLRPSVASLQRKRKKTRYRTNDRSTQLDDRSAELNGRNTELKTVQHN